MVTGLSGGASGLGGAITPTGELTLFSRFSILSLLSNAADAVFLSSVSFCRAVIRRQPIAFYPNPSRVLLPSEMRRNPV